MTDAPEEVDLGGDVFILVGPEGSQIRLKVLSQNSTQGLHRHSLSCIASLSHSVGPGFEEGTQCAQGKDIEIKKENTKAPTVLCEILHMRYTLKKDQSEPKRSTGLRRRGRQVRLC